MHRYILILILLIAFILRLTTLTTQAVVSTDSVDYLRLAENIFSGNGYKDIRGKFCERPPLYSIVTGIVRFIVPDTEKSGKIVSLFFGTVTVYIIYRIAMLVYGRQVALISAFLSAIHPFLIEVSTLVLRDALHLFLLLMAILLTISSVIDERRYHPFLIGIFLGLGYLTRIETVLYLISILIYIVFLKSLKNFKVPVIVLVFFLVILPYLIVIKNNSGEISMGGEIYRVNYIISQGKALFSKYIRYTNKAYLVVLPTIFPPLLLFFFAIGIGMYNYQDDRTRFITLTFFTFLPLLFHPFHWIHPRYFLIFIALGIIFSASGIIYFSKKWEQVFIILKKRLIYLCILTILISFLPKMTQPFREDRYYRHWIEHRDMGIWMRDNINGRPRIIARKPFVPFYAGGIAIFLPHLKPKSLYNFAVENKGEYLVVDERTIRRFRYTNLKPFLQGDIPEGFKLIHEIDKREGYRIRLFEIIKRGEG